MINPSPELILRISTLRDDVAFEAIVEHLAASLEEAKERLIDANIEEVQVKQGQAFELKAIYDMLVTAPDTARKLREQEKDLPLEY